MRAIIFTAAVVGTAVALTACGPEDITADSASGDVKPTNSARAAEDQSEFSIASVEDAMATNEYIDGTELSPEARANAAIRANMSDEDRIASARERFAKLKAEGR